MDYLGNAFSPSMLGTGTTVNITELSVVTSNSFGGRVSAISHEATANILSQKFGVDIPFNRINLTLAEGDTMLLCIPQFRADQAREFTKEELENSKFRFFEVSVFGFLKVILRTNGMEDKKEVNKMDNVIIEEIPLSYKDNSYDSFLTSRPVEKILSMTTRQNKFFFTERGIKIEPNFYTDFIKIEYIEKKDNKND